MSPRSIMKAMKYGLLGLTPEELEYFQDFGAEKDVDTWMKRLDDKLIWNLVATGLTGKSMLDYCYVRTDVSRRKYIVSASIKWHRYFKNSGLAGENQASFIDNNPFSEKAWDGRGHL